MFIVQKHRDPLLEAQRVMLDMMKEIHKICEANNILYWLSDGTLLGSVRHKGFIPWDDDVDFAILRDDYKKLKEALKKNLPGRYKVESKNEIVTVKQNFIRVLYTEDFEWIHWEEGTWKRGLWIDIFPFDYAREKGLMFNINKGIHRVAKITLPMKISGIKDLVKYAINLCQIHRIYGKINRKSKSVTYGVETPFYGWSFYSTDDIFPLKKGEFEGYLFNIPNNADSYLKTVYGDYMKMPDEKDRVSHMLNLRFVDDVNQIDTEVNR